jgi:hypothetical protein
MSVTNEAIIEAATIGAACWAAYFDKAPAEEAEVLNRRYEAAIADFEGIDLWLVGLVGCC